MSPSAVKQIGIGRSRHFGFTLIEVLTAMALSSFVLISVGYAYLTQRSLERNRGALAQVQDSARVAFEMLGRDIRQAGYIGCNSNLTRANQQTGPDVSVLPPFAVPSGGVDNFTIDATTAIRAFDGGSTDFNVWGGSVPANVLAGSHVIEVRYGSADGASALSQPIRADGQQIFTRSTVDLGRGDDTPTSSDMYALLSDCASGMIVVVDGVTSGPSSAMTVLNPIIWSRCSAPSRINGTCFYWPSATLMPIRVVQYYVANTGTAAAPSYGLFMRKRWMKRGPIQWNQAVQIIDSVNTFRVSGVGLDSSNPANTYWAAVSEVGDVAVPVADPSAVINLTPVQWSTAVRIDIRLSLIGAGQYGANAKPVVRNFESSFAVRSRAASEVLN
jgi:prepilin-type N-terminal cleavage/methylation domain-containing protein